MSFWNELWDDMKASMREVSREAWEKTKAAAKEEAKKIWKEIKENTRREWRRQAAPVPADVAQVLEATPESETPVIPYRTDTAPFLDRVLEDSNFERGWAMGRVGERSVRVRLPSKDAAILQVALAYHREHEREYEEMRKNAKVPQDILDLINEAPQGIDPIIEHREELGIYVDPDQDLGEVLGRGYLFGSIQGRRVRLDIRRIKSKLQEFKKLQDELEELHKHG